jgi:hypothetical protein
VAFEFQAKETHAIGVIENSRDPSGEHYIHGQGATTYSGVIVTKPAGKGCKIYADIEGVKGEEGGIKTNTLAGTSTEQGMFGKLEPLEGEVAARFFMEGCTLPGVNGTYTITGSIKCAGDGSTAICNHAETTVQGTLKLNGSINAGVEVSTTAKGRANSTEPYTPLAVTTVEIP